MGRLRAENSGRSIPIFGSPPKHVQGSKGAEFDLGSAPETPRCFDGIGHTSACLKPRKYCAAITGFPQIHLRVPTLRKCDKRATAEPPELIRSVEPKRVVQCRLSRVGERGKFRELVPRLVTSRKSGGGRPTWSLQARSREIALRCCPASPGCLAIRPICRRAGNDSRNFPGARFTPLPVGLPPPPLSLASPRCRPNYSKSGLLSSSAQGPERRTRLPPS